MGQLMGWCSADKPSVAPWGVNPHFLPTSPLYNRALANALASNSSPAKGTGAANSTDAASVLLNPKGLPFGFPGPLVSSQKIASS